MRRATLLATLLAAGLLLAGCTTDDPEESTLEESTEPPDEPTLDEVMPLPTTGDTTAPPADPTPEPAPAPVAEPAPQAPPAPAPAPPAPEPAPPAPAPPPAQAPPPPPPSPAPPPPSPTPPPPSPAPTQPSWPVAGSFVTYRFTGHENAPDASAGSEYDARVRLTFDGSTWTGTCTIERETYHTVSYDDEGNRVYDRDTSTETRQASFAPARGPTDVSIGDTVSVGVAYQCNPATMDDLTVESRTTHSAPRQADGSDTWYGHFDPEWPGEAYAYWDTKTGLTVAWRDQGSYSHSDGWIEDTDAPLS